MAFAVFSFNTKRLRNWFLLYFSRKLFTIFYKIYLFASKRLSLPFPFIREGIESSKFNSTFFALFYRLLGLFMLQKAFSTKQTFDSNESRGNHHENDDENKSHFDRFQLRFPARLFLNETLESLDYTEKKLQLFCLPKT